MSLEKEFAVCFQGKTENRFMYQIPEDFPAFNGHFAGNPLLPGVCQLGLCADALGRQLGKRVEIAAVSRCKFMAPIRPQDPVQITLTQRPDGQYSAELCNPQDGRKFCQVIFSGKVL